MFCDFSFKKTHFWFYLDIRKIEWIDVADSQSEWKKEKKRFPRFGLNFDLIDDDEVVESHVNVEAELGVVEHRKTSEKKNRPKCYRS
jgi:hypothetical protein